MQKTDDQWKAKLSDEQYRIMRKADTEAPFTGTYVHHKANGTYVCAACGTPLFSSDTKFDSKSGWPSFYDVIEKGNVELKDDASMGMARTEVRCKTCHGHLGHLFDDGPKEKTGKRYCINSAALNFQDKKSSG